MSEHYNILLLGKSGVGKSTLINSFANFLVYDTFKEALRSSPICVIPTKYYMESDSGSGFNIQLGTRYDNELDINGQSCTQNPRIYEFAMNDKKYNFIDAPGIGDTGDNQTVSHILTALSTFTELHGILILHTQQDSRLSTEYKYCLTEILKVIYQKERKNIFFVFTNSAAYNFRGGESLQLLRKYLNELKTTSNMEIDLTSNNTFFIDNEGFRLQGFYNQEPKSVSKNDLRRCIKSWNHTREEMYCLLDKVTKVKSHTDQNSITLNEARITAVLLLEPLATVTTLLAQNTLVIADNVNNMATMKNCDFRVYDIEIRRLEKPQTVCTSKTCITATPIYGTKNKISTTYSQVCHDPCYLQGVQLKNLPEKRLLNCAAMGGRNTCYKCAEKGHYCSYKAHMHIDYEQRMVVRETILSQALKDALNSTDSKASLKNIMQELEKELDVILSSVKTFMTFLNEHAIYEHNEYFDKLLDVEIRKEEVILKQTNQNFMVDKLKEIQKNHKSKMKLIVESSMEKSISVDNILEARDTLFHLKYIGPKIKEIYYITSGNVLENAKSWATTAIDFD